MSQHGERWYAYDGKRYQTLSKSDGLLGLSSSPAYEHTDLSVNPVCLPYLFLFASFQSESMREWTRLDAPETWTQAFQQARYIKEEKDENFTYDVVSFPGAVPEMPFKVWFARELGSYCNLREKTREPR